MRIHRHVQLAIMVGLAALGSGDARAETCGDQRPTTSFAFTGLYPAIEGRLPLASFKRGLVVEIDPATMSANEARSYIQMLQNLGARVSIYMVGGHCDRGRDCAALGSSVKLGSTGSWTWDRSEQRIVDITHRTVKERLARGVVRGFSLGANYIRIDNLHTPSGATGTRTLAQMREIVDLVQEIEDQMRADGSIKPGVDTGIVAHNNLVAWEELLSTKAVRRPPALLTSERTARLYPGDGWDGDVKMRAGRLDPTSIPEIEAGRRLALKLAVPYTIVEFRRTHDVANRNRYYALPQSFVEAASKLAGVTEVMVMPREGKYVGRGEVFSGPGPTTMGGQSAIGRMPPCN